MTRKATQDNAYTIKTKSPRHSAHEINRDSGYDKPHGETTGKSHAEMHCETTGKSHGQTHGTVTIFYACDDRYIPYLSVSLRSLIENSDGQTDYDVIILHSGVSAANKAAIRGIATENVKVRFADVSDRLRPLAARLSLRDYYSLSIYYRIFIPSLFPEKKKAVYLDSDTVVLSDIAELYRTELCGKMVAAGSDAVVAREDVFIGYAEEGVGVPYRRYFNSGVMVMDLEEMRRQDVQGSFTRLLSTYHFNTICPDQDYLNVICRGKVLYLGSEWNKMSVDDSPCGRLRLMHYNMFFKPWYYSDVRYQEHFWHYAARSPFYSRLLSERGRFGEEERRRDAAAGENLRAAATAIIGDAANFRRVLAEGEATV